MIIAEMCQNHQGNFETLNKMVIAASLAGAAAAKIQSFFADDLSEDFQSTHKRIKKCELTWEDHEKFVKICKDNDIIPMTSVYTDRYLSKIKQTGFHYIKIGSAQCTDHQLVKAYSKDFTTIISTGGTKDENITYGGRVYLHCVSEYPTSPDQANLNRMNALRYRFRTLVGWSDHTSTEEDPRQMVAKTAISLGADVVERHFTILPKDITKDGPVSINPKELKDLCDFDKKTTDQRILEDPYLGILSAPQQQSEISNIEAYQKRWKS